MLVSRKKLPAILTYPHDDWPWPFKYIPRRLNAWVSNAPYIALPGTTERAEDNLDIPERGKRVIAVPGGSLGLFYLFLFAALLMVFSWWALLALPWMTYVAVTTKGGWHFRFGTRKDYIDHYYVVPSAAFKHFRD